ncbi:MAG: tripartite tricarboxylate transporter TctB family protein [Kiloniellaceae bacterium]
MSLRERLRLGFGVFILCIFAYAAFDAWDFSRRARYMPLYVSVAGIVLTSLLITLDLWRMRSTEGRAALRTKVSIEDLAADDLFSPAEDRQRFRTTAYYLGWMAGYAAAIGIVGLPLASALFLAGFLLVEARMRLPGVGLCVAGMLAGMFTLTHFMHLRWPPNLIGW